MIQENNLYGGIDYYKFIGWVEDDTEFMKVIKDEIKSSEVINYIFNGVVKQAEEQAKHIHKDLYFGKDYIDYYQQYLEQIAVASMVYSSKYKRNKERDMFVFSKHLKGVYVFKQV